MTRNTARRGVAAALLALSAGLCVEALGAQEPSVKVITTTITSSGAFKECLTLASNHSLRYWLRADAVIDFNIQYQDDTGVVMPVKRDKVAIVSGSYAAKAQNVYCMVVTNPARQPVTVRLEFARVER